MKALTLILGSLLIAAGLAAADSRGLRRQGRDGDHGHHHGAAHNNRKNNRGGRRNNRRNNRRNQARQAFESGGYLAASDDYAAGEAPLPGYTEETDATTGFPDYAEYDTTDSASADAGYAGPGGAGAAASDPALGYDAPGAGADGYAAPGDYDESSTDIAQYDESLPSYDDPAADSLAGYANGDAAGSNPADQAAYEARQRRNGKSPAIGNSARNNPKFCPGGKLDSCISICPGGNGARVYASCVTSCAQRCSRF